MYFFDRFVPYECPNHPLDLNNLFLLFNKKYQYASRGRHSIYHILKSLKINGTVVVPLYSCPTIRVAVENAGCKCVFCDIDIEDLNISFDSFKKISANMKIDCVIVPSLYGNPANLARFEEYCREQSIYMIDDGAQSFGSFLDNRVISSFGDGGLIAFSPGKSTPWAMGSLFWTKNEEYSYKKEKHPIIHNIIKMNFEINRKNVYKKRNKIIKPLFGWFFNYLSIFLESKVDLKNDRMERFEEKKIGGVLFSLLDGAFSFRKKYFSDFKNLFFGNFLFRIVEPIRGNSEPCKIVLVFYNKHVCSEFGEYLEKKKIKTYNGYEMINDDNCPNCRLVKGKIVELPIENNEEKMLKLFEIIRDFIKKKEEEIW